MSPALSVSSLSSRRHQYLAAPCLASDASGHDHVLAEEVVRLLDRLSRVEADAHSAELVCGLVTVGEGALDLDRALEGAAGAPEREREAVALRLHLGALVACDSLAHDRVIFSQELQPALVARSGQRLILVKAGVLRSLQRAPPRTS